MREIRAVKALAAAAVIATALTACNSSNDSNDSTSSTPTSASTQSFASAYNDSLAALSSYSGLISTTLVDLFAANFIDAGYAKSQVSANLAQDAVALSISPVLSQFPMVKFTDATITNCSSSNVCTLTATITNTDVDTTSVTFTTQVVFSDGKYRLLGDQKSS